jgi:hypothetical protein
MGKLLLAEVALKPGSCEAASQLGEDHFLVGSSIQFHNSSYLMSSSTIAPELLI